MSHLDSLNPEQRKAAEKTKGPLLIVAGAGAGKTKTITHRIVRQVEEGVPPESILAVTFTNKAAGEMRERIFTLLSHIRAGNLPMSAENDGRLPCIATFHALGVRLLREFAPILRLSKTFGIWDRDDSIRSIKRAMKDLGIADQYAPKQVLGAISRQKNDGVSAEMYAEQARFPFERTVSSVWQRYTEALAREAALDFDDLLLKSLELIANNPDIRARLQRRWTHITIDEYQDTNRLQFEIARLLAGGAQNICVVGDTDQNIYSWRGADVSHLLSFQDTYPGAAVVVLEENYRSTQNILEAANAVIEKNVRRKKKRLFTKNGRGEAIGVFYGRSEADEAYFVAHTARSLIESGTKASEIAVLYRENFLSRGLEEAFLSLGVPYRVLGVRFFDRKEVKDLLSYVHYALHPESNSALARIIGVPTRGIGEATLAKIIEGRERELSGATLAKVTAFRSTIATISNALTTKPTSSAVRYALEASGLEENLRGSGDEGLERMGNMRELVAFASRYDDLPPPEGALKLLEDAALLGEQDGLAEPADAVSLMTVHASKGLEFDVVFVTGLEQGLFPSTRDDDERDSEEERRLFYVAVTRARTKLYITHAGSRMRYGSREFTSPSEFLDDIDESLVEAVMGGAVRSTLPGGRGGILDAYEEEEIR